MNKQLTRIARIVFAVPFLVFGVNHFLKADMMAGAVPSYLPGGIFLVYLTGLAMIAAAISFITGKYLRYSGYGLAALMIVYILMVHIPNLSNPQMQVIAFMSILKDIGLAGGALLLASDLPSQTSNQLV